MNFKHVIQVGRRKLSICTGRIITASCIFSNAPWQVKKKIESEQRIDEIQRTNTRQSITGRNTVYNVLAEEHNWKTTQNNIDIISFVNVVRLKTIIRKTTNLRKTESHTTLWCFILWNYEYIGKEYQACFPLTCRIDSLYSVHSNCHQKAGDKGMVKVPANAFPFLCSLEAYRRIPDSFMRCGLNTRTSDFVENWNTPAELVQRWSQIAFVNSVFVDLPPRSAVRYFPSAMVLRIASWILSALSLSFKWRSIVTALNSRAVGFAKSYTKKEPIG